MNKTIMCIDDEANIHTILIGAISGWGYDIQCAKNAKEATELFDAINPFLVITDLRIDNHVDGATLADRLHRRDPLCIFIALSGYLAAFDLGYLLGAVFTDVLQKPFGIKELKQIVDYAWEKRTRWQEYL